MGIFDKFKKFQDKSVQSSDQDKSKESKVNKPEPLEKNFEKSDAAHSAIKGVKKENELKGGTKEAYRVLIKPLITERASDLGALGKYIFAVDPKMNKIEIKKAIRSIYKVDPIQVNVSNFSGKSVRHGRVSGRTKSWKKAIVTLKEGDKIEVYEGV
ncbi:50S ribosomal protein L23 [Candidatus Falkowbacteria bacterium]|nr:50S ribosomal protein L23 [Candidatus Falkowbacteria bacterium]